LLSDIVTRLKIDCRGSPKCSVPSISNPISHNSLISAKMAHNLFLHSRPCKHLKLYITQDTMHLRVQCFKIHALV
jgi:hypothetical protein